MDETTTTSNESPRVDPQPAGASQVLGRVRWATLAAGWSLVVVGTALLVLPGPGLPLLLGGLALLGREQAWARRIHTRLEHAIRTRVGRAGAWFRRQPRAS